MTFMSEMNVFENEEGQEGFGLQRNITRQIQMIIATLEGARLTNNGMYNTYINSRIVFGSIEHAKLLTVKGDFGYPKD